MAHSGSDAREEIFRSLVMCPCTECKGLVGRIMNECLRHLRENGRYEGLQIDLGRENPGSIQHVQIITYVLKF
jgi:hypothetical protein